MADQQGDSITAGHATVDDAGLRLEDLIGVGEAAELDRRTAGSARNIRSGAARRRCPGTRASASIPQGRSQMGAQWIAGKMLRLQARQSIGPSCQA